MYIKSITFNSLSNGTLGSNDGSYNTSTKVFTVSGNKTSVNVVLTSSDNQKGSVKVSNVVIEQSPSLTKLIVIQVSVQEVCIKDSPITSVRISVYLQELNNNIKETKTIFLIVKCFI